MNSKDMINELRALNPEKLTTKADEVAEELMKLRFRKKSGQLSQTHHLRRARKDLARVLTIKNEPKKS